MTIRFAPARAGYGNPVARHLGVRHLPAPANDLRPTAAGIANDAEIYAALRHFGRHGLAAAREASSTALRCLRDGDAIGYEYWLSICHRLDRRMARSCQRQADALL